jgi:predicted transcriptional regulator YdeE
MVASSLLKPLAVKAAEISATVIVAGTKAVTTPAQEKVIKDAFETAGQRAGEIAKQSVDSAIAQGSSAEKDTQRFVNTVNALVTEGKKQARLTIQNNDLFKFGVKPSEIANYHNSSGATDAPDRKKECQVSIYPEETLNAENQARKVILLATTEGTAPHGLKVNKTDVLASITTSNPDKIISGGNTASGPAVQVKVEAYAQDAESPIYFVGTGKCHFSDGTSMEAEEKRDQWGMFIK